MPDLTGIRFENLLVIELGPVIEVGKSKKKRKTWKCLCDCGSIIYVTTGDLVSGNTKSCGCLISVGEKRVAEELTKRKVGFMREYSFPDLVSQKGYPLYFDFAITDADSLICLVEFQGIQHYVGTSEFGKQQREVTDKQKKTYCKNKNIPLFEIRYDENISDKIDSIIRYIHDNTVPRTVNNS